MQVSGHPSPSQGQQRGQQQRLQMSVHKQLEQLVSRLCDRDRTRNLFFELHNPPIT